MDEILLNPSLKGQVGPEVSCSPGWPRNHSVKGDLDLLIFLPPPPKQLGDQFTTRPTMSSLFSDED